MNTKSVVLETAGKPTGSSSPQVATLVLSRVVKSGRDEDYCRWGDRIDQLAQRFDGHRGSVRLAQPSGVNHLICQFDTTRQLAKLEASAAFATLIEQGDRFSVQQRQLTCGLPARFIVPSEAAAAKWKTFLVTWCAVYPTAWLLNALVGLSPLALPLPLKLAATTLPLTAALTWIILPRVSRLLRPWMLADGNGVPRNKET